MRALLVSPILLIAVFLMTSCATKAGVAYSEAVRLIDAHLEKADKYQTIFALENEPNNGSAAFDFVDGSPRDKINHAMPLRVHVVVRSRKDGSDSSINVVANQHGLVTRRRDDAAAARWKQTIGNVAAGIEQVVEDRRLRLRRAPR